jgi:ribosome modulation factor
MRQYRQQKRLCEEANGVLRNIVKRAKADGMNAKAMISAVKATKLDPVEVAKDLQDEIRYMQIIRIPITAEDLLAAWDSEVNSKTRREDDLWDADDKGYRAGRAGTDISEMPYDDAEMEKHWKDAWHKGQAAIARELGQDVKQGNASRQRPARDEQPRLADVAEGPEDPPYVPGAVAAKKVGRPRGKKGVGRSAVH